LKIKLSRTDTYIPKWNGNRKLPTSDQVKIEYRFMTCEEEEKYSALRPVFSSDKSEVRDVTIDVHTHANEIWDVCVKKVDGLTDDNGVGITDPRKVRAVPGVYGLVTEVVAEIKTGITVEQSKN
jgi:hypothetical protein